MYLAQFEWLLKPKTASFVFAIHLQGKATHTLQEFLLIYWEAKYVLGNWLVTCVLHTKTVKKIFLFIESNNVSSI